MDLLTSCLGGVKVVQDFLGFDLQMNFLYQCKKRGSDLTLRIWPLYGMPYKLGSDKKSYNPEENIWNKME